jgi:hypothetical protein
MTIDREYMDFMTEMVQQRLLRLFALTRTQFFPRWDSMQEWRITAKRKKGTGYCSSKEKMIYICPNGVKDMPDDGLLALIIHEVCHDVATAYHTERWVERMEKAAKKAETLSQPKLAYKIRASAYCEIPQGKPWREKWCKYLYHSIHAAEERLMATED